MKRRLVLAAFFLALLAGCGMTPRQKLFSGYQSYKAVAVLLMEARRTGVIESDVLWEHILKVDVAVYKALLTYKAAIETGRAADAEWMAFNAALDKLLELYQRLPEPADKPVPDNPTLMEVTRWRHKKSSWPS